MNKFALALVALSLAPALAFANCKAQFKGNLDQIRSRSARMRPTCWHHVQKGDANTSNIMSACNDQEIDLAQAMDTFEKRNVSLCQGSCSSELNAAGVCVDGKSLGYYYSKLSGKK